MKIETLKNKKDFADLFNGGRRYSGRLLSAVTRNAGANRVGIVVGKKFGGAVIRNRIKRRIRAAYRAAKSLKNADMVILPKQAALKAEIREITAEIEHIIDRT